MTANADQIEFWNGRAGEHWVVQQTAMDRNMRGIHDAILAFAAPASGETVTDIGCGAGTTTLAIADAVGTGGKVTGVDISVPMLGLAKERAKAAGKAIDFINADASAYPFRTKSDLVFSRFGVMFFDSPPAAFANIHTALKPSGRIAFVCWRTPQENAWAFAPMMAARPFLPPQPPPDPLAPGPFAFADPDRIKMILTEAGFRAVKVEKLDSVMNLGPSLDGAVDMMMTMGPLSRALNEADDATRAKIRPAVRAALEPYVTADGVQPPAGCWLAGAKA
ncbi:MAG TPA: methyltransferase domain-containing protein [Rhizomicrobium sp.]|jgi:SAM-dependent methyltransferase